MNGIATSRPMKREDTKSAENPCKSLGQRDPEDSQKLEPIDVRSSTTISPTSLQNLPLVMSELTTRCEEAELKATHYAQILEARIESPGMIEKLHGAHVQAFSFLGTNNTGNKTRDMNETQRLEMDFRHVGNALVYLKQLTKDDMQHDSGLNRDDLMELERNITRVYCLLQSIGDFAFRFTNDVMSTNERNVSSIAKRLQRDYVFVTDLVELLKIKEQTYNEIRTKLVG